MKSARSVAVGFLLAVDKGRHCDALAWDRGYTALGERDRRLTTQLVYGVLRHRGRLDYFASKLLRKPMATLDAEVLWILRVGLYQLEFLRIPDRAAVHESVELCRHFRKSSAAALVNAVLRSFSRQKPPLPQGRRADKLAVIYSHPEWLVRRYLHRFGYDRARTLMERNNAEVEPTLWINPRKTSFDGFLATLNEQGIEYEVLEKPVQCVRVTAGFSRHPLYRRGFCFFMDCASQDVATRVQVNGCRVVGDFCAAPGGKAFLLSSRIEEGAALYCSDVDLGRLGSMRQRGELYAIDTPRFFLSDWSRARPVKPVFDSVLLDVPCSGLGTLRSNPDIRWKIHEEDFSSYQKKQLSILLHSFGALRPGGELLYSTCSTEPEENEDVIQQFLAEESRAELVEDYWKTFPEAYPGDCFFTARIRHSSGACAKLP